MHLNIGSLFPLFLQMNIVVELSLRTAQPGSTDAGVSPCSGIQLQNSHHCETPQHPPYIIHNLLLAPNTPTTTVQSSTSRRRVPPGGTLLSCPTVMRLEAAALLKAAFMMALAGGKPPAAAASAATRAAASLDISSQIPSVAKITTAAGADGN